MRMMSYLQTVLSTNRRKKHLHHMIRRKHLRIRKDGVMFIPSPIKDKYNSSSNEGKNPLTIKVIPTNIPKKVNPTSMPMLLRDSLAAVWFKLRTDLIMSLAEIFVDMDSAKEASA